VEVQDNKHAEQATQNSGVGIQKNIPNQVQQEPAAAFSSPTGSPESLQSPVASGTVSKESSDFEGQKQPESQANLVSKIQEKANRQQDNIGAPSAFWPASSSDEQGESPDTKQEGHSFGQRTKSFKNANLRQFEQSNGRESRSEEHRIGFDSNSPPEVQQFGSQLGIDHDELDQLNRESSEEHMQPEMPCSEEKQGQEDEEHAEPKEEKAGDELQDQQEEMAHEKKAKKKQAIQPKVQEKKKLPPKKEQKKGKNEAKPHHEPLHLEIHIKGKAKIKAPKKLIAMKGTEKINYQEENEGKADIKHRQEGDEQEEEKKEMEEGKIEKNNEEADGNSVEDQKSLLPAEEEQEQSDQGEKKNKGSSGASGENDSGEGEGGNDGHKSAAADADDGLGHTINTDQVPKHFYEEYIEEPKQNEQKEEQKKETNQGSGEKKEAPQKQKKTSGHQGGEKKQHEMKAEEEEDSSGQGEQNETKAVAKHEHVQVGEKEKKKKKNVNTVKEQGAPMNIERKEPKKAKKVVENKVQVKEEAIKQKVVKKEEEKVEKEVVKEEKKEQEHEGKGNEKKLRNHKHAHIELHQHKHFEHHEHINLAPEEEHSHGGQEHQGGQAEPLGGTGENQEQDPGQLGLMGNHQNYGHNYNQPHGQHNSQPLVDYHSPMVEKDMDHQQPDFGVHHQMGGGNQHQLMGHQNHQVGFHDDSEHEMPMKENWETVIPEVHEKPPSMQHKHGAIVIEDHSLLEKHEHENPEIKGVHYKEDYIGHPHGLGLTPVAAYNLMSAYSSPAASHAAKNSTRSNDKHNPSGKKKQSLVKATNEHSKNV